MTAVVTARAAMVSGQRLRCNLSASDAARGRATATGAARGGGGLMWSSGRTTGVRSAGRGQRHLHVRRPGSDRSAACRRGWSRVACRLGIDASFPEASELLTETLGVSVDDEGVRRITEGIGAVAEAEQQAAMARAVGGQEPWPGMAAASVSPTLLVTVDGVLVHEQDAWHECKIGVLAPLGPSVRVDADSGRQCLQMGAAVYRAGFEAAERFWYRVYSEACRQGLGNATVVRVVVVGDGAERIRRGARAFLGVGAVEVIEIVDFYHAVEHLWGVANATFGAWQPRRRGVGDAAEGAVVPLRRRTGADSTERTAGRSGRERGSAEGAGLFQRARAAHGLSRLHGPAIAHRLGNSREQL